MSDWELGRWLGGGQNEFKFQLELPAAVRDVIMYVAAPGGSIVYTPTEPAGTEGNGTARSIDVGVSAWIDFDKMVRYQAYPIPATSGTQWVTLLVGHGFYTCNRNGRNSGHCGRDPAARVLVVATTAANSSTGVAVPLEDAPGPTPSGAGRGGGDASVVRATVVGRVGAIIADDPWTGTITNWSVSDTERWTAARAVPDAPKGAVAALQVERAPTAGRNTAKMPSAPVSVAKLGPNAWHYTFSRNIVGHVVVRAGSYSGPGNVSLNHCEVMNGTVCGGLGGMWTGLGTDVHILPAGHGARALRPRFTWHGFQHVIVTCSGGAHFDGRLGSLAAVWTVAAVAESATITFQGPGSELLSRIRDMTKASQLGNMAGYLPTDCPTREKHAWLGDASVTAEEAMYNLFAPGVWELFLDTVHSEQVAGGNFTGFVPMAVPSTPAEWSWELPGDISWTAGYPLIVRWYYWYYGDLSVVRHHWPHLLRYIQSLEQVAAANRTALPAFFTCGDWSAVEVPRAACTAGTGPAAAAANFLLALEAMAEMATALGEPAAAADFQRTLARLRGVFEAEFFNSTVGTYANRAIEAQTLSALGLAAGAAQGHHRRSAVAAALQSDVVARGHHLTVGSAGQKWLLRELSANGAHDTALALALQTTQPSWGFWASEGATTCWESWSGVEDGTHPGNCYDTGFAPGCVPNPPTHNHIFLCGGVGEWLYRSLGGISPAAAGYAAVRIRPEISERAGPTGVNMSVATVRGTVVSRWTRLEPGPGGTGAALRLSATIPVGIAAAHFELPLLHTTAAAVVVTEATTGARLWGAGVGGPDAAPGWLRPPRAPRPAQAADGRALLVFSTAPGRFEFVVEHLRRG